MELEVTRNRAIRIWWSYLWRNFLAIIVGLVLGAVLGVIAGLVGGILRLPMLAIQSVAAVVGIVIGLAISVVPTKLILGKDYSDVICFHAKDAVARMQLLVCGKVRRVTLRKAQRDA